MTLIVLASAVLLVSDWARRRGGKGSVIRIAILQHAATPPLDDGAAGMIAGLAQHGFKEGKNITIKRYNAQGDMATGNSIAHEITGGQYDVAFTVSTPSTQAVAMANKHGEVTQVFSTVADPFAAGIGLDRANPLHHPRHLVGVGILLPVDQSFQLAKKCLPGLQVVGVAWNPAESNSQVYMKLARVTLARMNIRLEEANVENTAAVGEAVKSLISRGVQAIWVGGDNTMSSAMGSVIAIARDAKIPVITLTPAKPDRGTLLDCGVDFYDGGVQGGVVAAKVLSGEDTTRIPIVNVADMVKHHIYVNLTVVKNLKDPWQIPDDVLQMADAVVDDTGVHRKTASTTAGAHK
jgi:putative ABC transport system substrate-binding protein